MTNFNFDDETLNLYFNFGPSGSFLNLDFTDLAEGGYDFNFGKVVSIYQILKGQNNVFNSIWCDEKSGLNKGKFYTSTNDSISIVNLTSNRVEDFYTKTSGGQAKEPLISDDIVDINVSR